MTQGISILGSTGSIGRQTIEVAKWLQIPVKAISGNRNIDLLESQAREVRPLLVAVGDEKAAKVLGERLQDTGIPVVSGMEGLIQAAVLPEADTVLTAVVGMVGLRPTLEAIECGKTIALANKETLVCAGALVMERARETGARILPVDSEHSAIFQCLNGTQGEIRRLLLTASGGPFFGMDRAQLEHVTLSMALQHPNWTMGPKITVDSATLMNKGLEYIEAMHLFGVTPEQISVLVHRESIVHSMVEFEDGAVIAQMGTPDMRLPIQYALTYPERKVSLAKPLDFTAMAPLTFEEPDVDTFGCLKLAMEAADQGGADCAVLNAANEVAVELFLKGRLRFVDIERIVLDTLTALGSLPAEQLSQILDADQRARAKARALAGAG